MGEVGRGRSIGRAPGQVFQSGVHLSLRGTVAEVGHQAHAEGVRAVPALDDAQVAGCLCQALPEAQAAVILSKSMSLKVTCQGREQRQRVREGGCDLKLHFVRRNYV